jgi:hypothetical protein
MKQALHVLSDVTRMLLLVPWIVRPAKEQQVNTFPSTKLTWRHFRKTEVLNGYVTNPTPTLTPTLTLTPTKIIKLIQKESTLEIDQMT